MRTFLLSVFLILISSAFAATTRNESLNLLLIKAVSEGNVKQVGKLISKGADVNAKDKAGYSALIIAAKKGKSRLVKLLVDAGADKDYMFYQWSALNAAVLGNHMATVQVLVESGADINLSRKDEGGPLHLAIWKKHREIAFYLIRKGADVNKPGNFGATPLLEAASTGDREIVDVLIQRDAKIDSQNDEGSNALISASAFGHYELVNFFLSKGLDVNSALNTGETALFLAVRNTSECSHRNQGHIRTIKLLLKNRAAVNVHDNDIRKTALMHAANNRCMEIVKILLAAGSDIKARDANGYTALTHAVCAKNNLPVVKLLVEKGSDINHRNKKGRSVLYYAKKYGSADIVNYLMKAGASE